MYKVALTALGICITGAAIALHFGTHVCSSCSPEIPNDVATENYIRSQVIPRITSTFHAGDTVEVRNPQGKGGLWGRANNPFSKYVLMRPLGDNPPSQNGGSSGGGSSSGSGAGAGTSPGSSTVNPVGSPPGGATECVDVGGGVFECTLIN
jgi:hypothetical protein